MKRRSLNRSQRLFLIISIIVAIGMICSLIATIVPSYREDTGFAPFPAAVTWDIPTANHWGAI